MRKNEQSEVVTSVTVEPEVPPFGVKSTDTAEEAAVPVTERVPGMSTHCDDPIKEGAPAASIDCEDPIKEGAPATTAECDDPIKEGAPARYNGPLATEGQEDGAEDVVKPDAGTNTSLDNSKTTEEPNSVAELK